MSITFKQFLEAKQLLLFEPEPTEVPPAKIIKSTKPTEVPPAKIIKSTKPTDIEIEYDKLADRGGLSHEQIMRILKLKENHSWSEFNYRFGEDPDKTKKKARKLRKKFGIQLDMPGDYD